MTTPNDDIIQELRQAARKDSMFGDDVRKHLCERAADALLQQRESVAKAELQIAELLRLRGITLCRTMGGYKLMKLAEVTAQTEPVAQQSLASA